MKKSKEKGIDVTSRKMYYQPWPIDDRDMYRNPSEEEVKKTYCISGEAFSETLLYFEECADREYLNPEGNKSAAAELVKLLNEHAVDNKFIINKKKLLDKNRWYTNEYYFYFIMFTKKIIGRYNFHFGENKDEPLSIYHKIYEQGFVKYVPWGKDETEKEVHEITSSNIYFCILILEKIYKIDPVEFISFLDAVLPDKYKVDKNFFKNESIWCSLEFIDYGFEFLKIISNNDYSFASDLYDISVDNVKMSRILLSVNKKLFMKNITDIFKKFNDVAIFNIFFKKNKLFSVVTAKEGLYNKKYRKYFKSSFLNASNALIGLLKTIFDLVFNKKNIKNFNVTINYDIDNPEIRISKKNIFTKKIRLLLTVFFILFISCIISLLFYVTKSSFLSIILFPFIISLSGYFVFYFFNKNNELNRKIQTYYNAAQEQIGILESTTKELLNERNSLEEKVKKRTKELQDANEKLKELDQAKTKIFANISHELRTPLTLITSPIRSLISGDYGEKIDKNNKIFLSVLNNANRLLKLINGLLNFTKIEANKMHIKKQKTNIGNLLKYYTSSINSAAKSKNIELVYKQESLGINAYIDRDLFETAVFNLLSNAFKFTPPGGKIIVTLYKVDKNFIIEISDTGIGIPENKIDKIFERFVQVDESLSRKYEGSGIGLSLTKEIIKIHNGVISVKSKPGEGTIFIIKLPINFSDDKRLGKNFDEIKPEFLADFKCIQQEKEWENYDNSKKNLFIIEDNIEMINYLKSILTDKYNIYTALNGKEALEKIKNIPEQDLIISDIMMPEMDGKIFFYEIKKNRDYKYIPFIFLTARADIKEKIEGLKDGAVDYICKPFSKDELAAKIDSLLFSYESFRSSLKEKLIDTLYDKVDKKRQSNFNILKLCKTKNITTREMDIIALLNDGHEYKEIGSLLSISVNTVSNHVQRIYKKFNVNNKVDLINELKKVK